MNNYEERAEVLAQMEHKRQKEDGKHSDKWCQIGLERGRYDLVCADCQYN